MNHTIITACDHDLYDLARVDRCGAPATHLISSPEWRDEYGSCYKHLAAWAAWGTRHEYGVGIPIDAIPIDAPGAGAQRVIISRHPAAVEYIRGADLRFANAPVVATATVDDVRGKHVAGNIPLHLAVLAYSVTAVEFDGPAPRGAEYTLDEMTAAGARLATYVVCDGGAPTRVARLVETESHAYAARDAVRAMLGEERSRVSVSI